MADCLGCAKSEVSLLRGETSRTKVLEFLRKQRLGWDEVRCFVRVMAGMTTERSQMELSP